MIKRSDITAVILAGGRGRRMEGADKGLLELDGKPLVTHITQKIAPQVGQIIINANRNHEQYAALGYPVLDDELENYQGPLAGFAVGMRHAKTRYIVTLPCDGPDVASDFVALLTDALATGQAELAVADDGERLQPVHALLPVSLLPSLKAFLDNGDRKIDLWYAQHPMARADFSARRSMFRNINTPQDQQAFSRTA